MKSWYFFFNYKIDSKKRKTEGVSELYTLEVYKAFFSTLKAKELQGILFLVWLPTKGRKVILEDRLAEFFSNFAGKEEETEVKERENIQLLMETCSNRIVKAAVKGMNNRDKIERPKKMRVCFD